MSHHVLYLLLGGATGATTACLIWVAEYSLTGSRGVDRRDDGFPWPGPELQGRVRVARHEDPLDGELVQL